MGTSVVFQESPKGPRAEVIKAMVDERQASQAAASASADSASQSAASASAALISASAAAAAKDNATNQAAAADAARAGAVSARTSAEAARDAAIIATGDAEAARDAAEAAALTLGATAYALAADLPLAPAANAKGYVYADPTTSNNGLWFWGASGPWEKDAVNAATTQDLADTETALADEVEERSLLVRRSSSGDVLFMDESRAVFMRISPDGRIRSPMLKVGQSEEPDVVFKDAYGFVLARLAGLTGDFSLMGRAILRGSPKAGFRILDKFGFVMLNLLPDGTLRVMGREVASYGAGGFLEEAVSVAPEVELERTGILRRSSLDLQNWRQARGNVVQAYGEARILCIGDSNTAGGSVEVGVSRRANAYPTALARILDRHYGATSAGFIGSAGQGAAYPTYDPRITLAAGWSPVGGEVSLGGEVFLNTTTTGAMTFTPGIEWDTAEITLVGIEAGAVDVGIGGGTTALSNTVGAVSVETYNAGSVGPHTLNIARASGGARVGGIVCRNSQTKAVTVINAGRGGWRSSDIIDATNFYSPGSVLPAVQADLVIIEIGLNDMNVGVTPATFEANLQAIVDLCPAGADVVIMSSVTPDDTGEAYPWTDYLAAMRAVAAANGLPMIDMTQALGDRTSVTANGWNVDALHPTRAGLAEKAHVLAKLLTT